MLLLLLLLIMATMVHAQISIGGHVYGGGNQGNVKGSTSVTVRAGDLNEVYGGARMADVNGNAFVNIDGEHASDFIVINKVFGGNDISGIIGETEDAHTLPNSLLLAEENHVDKSWDVFVRISTKTAIENGKKEEVAGAQKIYIGQLFAGGNGDYDYTSADYAGKVRPDIDKAYLEVVGGSIVYAYGGGNNATVTENTVICVDNPSKVVNSILDKNGNELLTTDRFRYQMGINTGFSYPSSDAFQIGRFFGGNNKANMAIRPTWNLKRGLIRNIYSGGNQGAMTNPKGILLPIKSDDMKIDNVFGGCRMADVNPDKAVIPAETIDGTYFPAGYAARVLIEGGDINNVYGGNDISGKVYGGNAVGIHSSIKGDVYGGGNGSYPYTDNTGLKGHDIYGDLYYGDFMIEKGYTSSVEALNAFRPNAESVSIRLVGTETKKTIIGGAVYCGGNSATLHNDTEGVDAAAELKIGSYVIADKVFLGNNGEKMKDPGILELYAKSVDELGKIVESGGYDFSQMDLASSETNNNGQTQFDIYMDGVTMDVLPRVVFDDIGTYVPYSTYFGSFYCGGNVGSMRHNGAINLSFTDKVVIFDKFVGGSNEANIYKGDYNTEYLGGLLGNPDANGNKLIMNLSGLKIQPMRWNSTYAPLAENENLVVGNKYYTSALGDGEFTATSTTKEEGKTYYKMTDRGSDLVWNTISASTGNNVVPITSESGQTGQSDANDLDRRLKGGNIYGGCYLRGHVNGNVVINLNASIHERDRLFDVTDEGDILYENTEKKKYNITQRNTGVILSEQGMDVLGGALNVFGGGYGGDSEIWGSTTINLNAGYTFQIFGGGEMGAIGKAEKYNEETKKLEYDYNPKYSTYINLNGDASLPGVARNAQGDDTNMAECEFIYGGSFEGLICGDTHINLGNGRVFNTFAGSCNADILGHTETYIGRSGVDADGKDIAGFPWIRDHVYGANDLGGSILGHAAFNDRVRDEVKNMVNTVYGEQVSKVAAYMEYTQGRVVNILGGCFGNYNYEDAAYKVGTGEDCRVANKPYLHNAFVNIRPNTNANNAIAKVFGAGEGYSGDRDGDKLQDHSYVLIDIPDGVENFADTEVFGAGAFNGLGMREFLAPQAKPAESATLEELKAYGDYKTALDEASAIIDLMRGKVGAAYGGSYEQGVTRRTVVNVPEGSTIKIGSIFGGAYGSDTYLPCDVYEANVNYHSADAYLIYNPLREDEKTKQMIGNELQKGAIYGGNNQERRTLYGRINIDVPVKQKHYLYDWSNATVYGAGCGQMTWNEYTEVNLYNGAKVWEVYGGGEAGGVMSAESVQAYIALNPINVSPAEKWKAAWTLGSGYDDGTFANETNSYASNTYTNLSNPLVREAEIDDRADIASTDTKHYKRYNTNVIIHKGAYVGNYAYGGGLGKEGEKFFGSGDVYGTTYIALLGGTVNKDIYAAGTVGAVYNLFGAKNYTASTNAYIAGGMLRNVYGGGWKGDLGRHTGTSSDPNSLEGDILGEAHVVIGIRPDQTDENLVAELKKVTGKDDATKADYGFYAGVPAIQRNAYGGGEGGAVFGSSYLTINNGYIGYVHLNADETLNEYGKIVTTTETTQERYEAKIHDDTYWDGDVWKGANRLVDCGNIFGGGYDVRSSVDETHVTLWNGIIRNSMHGGGEIATIGRGAVTPSGQSNSIRTLTGFYKAGKTNVEMFNGHVLRNVFGGGKGYNMYGYGQEGTLYTDGYVFGQTEVHIHGGEIGTDEGLANGYGNVFGGGDIGYVYSPSSPRYYLATTLATKIGTGSPGHFYYYNDSGEMEEDCKVVISPWLQVRNEAGATINTKTKAQYEYFETEDLNTLVKGADEWSQLFTGDYVDGNPNPADPVERGVKIHNAVFGGGNVSSNSDQTYANATTVYGNTTATINDIYYRDFITVGTEHTGGLYGGGNLSVVDGYRELNITNYGTDYYGLESTISLEKYRGLSNRERAYFKLKYKCISTIEIGGVTYTSETPPIDEELYLKYLTKFPAQESAIKAAFEPYGFCSIYAGRLLNTIQRADLCGVFGSRMVLQGAKDRVAEVGEDIDYTINRVGELSLNMQRSGGTTHGNYFGIYSVVNYLGNLTSDVHFSDDYVNSNGTTDPSKSFYSYKTEKHNSSDRNKGQSLNQVALASGVFLELTTENSTADKKDYGYVTGVIELDLINVKKDLVGGGFVYAKNEHRVSRYYPSKQNVILSPYNKQTNNEAITYKRYRYSTSDPGEWPNDDTAITLGHGDNDHEVGDFGLTKEWQTSGNFIHSSKRIVDDCYPTNNAYNIGSANYSQAHYWYVKGDVYIYDQKVSAYTGSANAYSKFVNLPLTITAASHGKLQLLNVKPNLYAYYTDNNGTKVKLGTEGTDGEPINKVTVNNESDTYHLNDVISWWDWYQMTASDRQYFVPETYVNCLPCTVNGVSYEAGAYVMLPSDSADFKTNYIETNKVIDTKGDPVTKFYELFRSSNNISHDTGYVLTLDMNSPKKWDDWYSPASGTSTYTVSEGTVTTTRIDKQAYDALVEKETYDNPEENPHNWREGPTFTPTTSGVYGKRTYTAGDVITETAYNNAPDVDDNQNNKEDIMKRAYVATSTVTYTYGGIQKTMNPGAAISATEYGEIGAAQSSFDLALICTNTVKLSKNEYMLYGELKTAAEITAIKAAIDADETRSSEDKAKVKKEIDAAIEEAYILTASGPYGGQRFNAGTNYGAIEAWCSLPSADRKNFNYNYDALDLLVDSEYLTVDATEIPSMPAQSSTVATYKAPYTDIVPVEYQAVFKKDGVDVEFNGNNLDDGAILTNQEYETIRNDKKHYTHIKTTKTNETVYIAKTNFVYLGIPYGVGQLVDEDVYTNNKDFVDDVKFENTVDGYYCFEGYTKKDGTTTVEEGTIILEEDYKDETKVPNYQQYFIIQGKEPTETTTLYVSRESNAYDVMKEKIITVVYQYTYNEDDDDGSVKTTNELHVINIHLQLESGAPVIGLLKDPPTVLPGNAVGLSRPDVNPGLYEVLSNGWELYATLDDATNHRNGVPFENNSTPVYWYQNQKNWVAFYSRTWLGKTYSNSVPLSVANYHDLDKVMNDKDHHLYVDKSNVDRPCKIYLDDRECESDPNKNELDLLKDFFDLSVHSTTEDVTDGVVTTAGALKDHALLGSYVHAGRNLEFFLNSDIDHSTKPNPDYDPEDTENPKPARIPATWTPIGDNNTTGDTGGCFEGILHGDGHTISGLTNSLFAHLCGEVYNLGVTGSFTGAGIAEEGSGYVENCWVKTSDTPAEGVNAVFNNPSRTEGDKRGLIQVENCYYPESNNYSVPSSNTHGKATQMPDKAFYNGEVAYNLNGFYLHKRYYQGTSLGAGENNTGYLYLPSAEDGTLPDNMSTGYYPNEYALYRPVLNAVKNPIELAPNYMGYVESRFYDGDYRYADGTIPESTDIHMRTVTVGEGDEAVTTTYYVPIWPDDYIFFGQTLNYGYGDEYGHQDIPSHINKNSGRLLSDASGNRVYRAPAYYGNNEMQAAYFNPNAVFAKTKKDDETVVAYKGMTAIDFTGYNDASYKEGLQDGKFYPPLLDDDGLTGFTNVDLTQNLLAYAPAETAVNEGDYANKATHDVLDTYFGDLAYVELGDDSSTDADETNYHRVAPVTVYDEQSVRGHVVFQTGTNTYSANRDHFLVDKQDFNAPIPYTFYSTTSGEVKTGNRMWYQRQPENFVGKKKEDESGFIPNGAGWEGISLPFTAEIVTTNVKGEITHFYNDGDNWKGHEYWLREYKGKKSGTEVTNGIFTADFSKPEKSTADESEFGTKTYFNTFLWNYYYKHNDFYDKNSDKYPGTYYSESHEYTNYPRLANATPYIIGFPGERYYEFDLSGNFEARTAKATIPELLSPQTITFASVAGASIDVSNTELKNGRKSASDYTFVPNYASETLGSTAYILNTDDVNVDMRGSSYNVTTSTAPATTLPAVPFRPYFMATSNMPAARQTTRSIGQPVHSIIFSEDNSQLQGDEEREKIDEAYSLSIYAKRKKIVVESNLREITEVRIVNTAGITMNAFTIEPGETVTTRVNNSGVYIVQTTDGHYTKKLAVR